MMIVIIGIGCGVIFFIVIANVVVFIIIVNHY